MTTYEVSKLPNRKLYCLLRNCGDPNKGVTVVAWFVSKEAAEQFIKEVGRDK